MALFYKVSHRMRQNNQDAINVLYFRPPVPDTAQWDATVALNLLTAARDAWSTTMMPRLFSGMLFTQSEISAVNERNEVISPYVISVSQNVLGQVTGNSLGPGRVGIVAFRCLPLTLLNPSRVPKRSYIALPWGSSTQAGTSGEAVWPTASQTDITAVLTQGHLISAVQYTPVRVGVPNQAGIPAVGDIQGVIFRPYLSVRRSRMIAPSGEGE